MEKLEVCLSQNMYLLFLNVVTAKKTRKSLGNPTEVNDEGFLKDVDVQVIEKEPTREDRRNDIDYHFREPVLRSVNGKMKKYCSCKLCPYVSHLSFSFTDRNHFCQGQEIHCQ